jgi:hypothetical protein
MLMARLRLPILTRRSTILYLLSLSTQATIMYVSYFFAQLPVTHYRTFSMIDRREVLGYLLFTPGHRQATGHIPLTQALLVPRLDTTLEMPLHLAPRD